MARRPTVPALAALLPLGMSQFFIRFRQHVETMMVEVLLLDAQPGGVFEAVSYTVFADGRLEVHLADDTIRTWHEEWMDVGRLVPLVPFWGDPDPPEIPNYLAHRMAYSASSIVRSRNENRAVSIETVSAPAIRLTDRPWIPQPESASLSQVAEHPKQALVGRRCVGFSALPWLRSRS